MFIIALIICVMCSLLCCLSTIVLLNLKSKSNVNGEISLGASINEKGLQLFDIDYKKTLEQFGGI